MELLRYHQSQSVRDTPSKFRIGFVEMANLAKLDLIRLDWSHRAYNIAYEPGTLLFIQQTIEITRLGVMIVVIIRRLSA